MSALVPAFLHSVSLTMLLIVVVQPSVSNPPRSFVGRYIISGLAICVIALFYNFQAVGLSVTLAIVIPALLIAFAVIQLPPRPRRIVTRICFFGWGLFFFVDCIFWNAWWTVLERNAASVTG